MTAAMDANRLVQAALEYAGYGWHVLPIREQSKLPAIKEWQHAASTDEEQIAAWWEKWPAANVGVLLGAKSGLIDLECDTPAAEQEFLRLFGGAPPVTCCYQGQRGKHRLFRWRNDLPGGAVVKLGAKGAEIEVRTGNGGKGAQSVFPPSIHPSGVVYQWLVTPAECPPADLPKEVLARLWNLAGESLLVPAGPAAKPDDEWERILGGSNEGHRNTDMASYCGKLLRGAATLNDGSTVKVLFQSAEAVNARNKPPLSDKELRTIFTSILKREQSRRLGNDADEILPAHPEKQVEDAKKPDPKHDTGAFRLVIVHSDPPRYELHAPQFYKAEGSCIVLTAEQMNSARAIRVLALKQAEYPLPKEFDRLWSKKDGLYERLIFTAEHKAAPLEEQRHLVVAEMLLDQIEKARRLDDGKEPDPRGRPSMNPAGEVLFKFNHVLEPMRRSDDKIERGELSKVLQAIGVQERQVRAAGRVLRFKVLSPEAVTKLRQLCKVEGA